ncbi:MAG: lysophospholipid acyltransferase family protein [Bacteroidaceae bacterium]|nr:lysophospholipid acyltransferase family protein [Bacteroidaceae bacterium]
MKNFLTKTVTGILYGLIWLLSLLPLCFHYLISDIIWLIMFVCPPLRYRHKVVWKNLKGSFPEKTDKELHAIERRFYFQFLNLLFETFKTASMGSRWIKRHLRIEGAEYINSEFAKGRSMIMYLGHIGNWEWISSLPAYVTSDKVECCQVYHPLQNGIVNDLMFRIRGQFGATSIPLKHVYRRLLEYRRDNRQFIVGLISDQAPLWWDMHYWGNFLNHRTSFLTGGEELARKMDLSVCYGHISLERRGHYVLRIVPMFDSTSNLDKGVVTDTYVRLLEDNIRESPFLWLWTHNRWKRTWDGYQSWLKNSLKSSRRDDEKE